MHTNQPVVIQIMSTMKMQFAIGFHFLIFIRGHISMYSTAGHICSHCWIRVDLIGTSSDMTCYGKDRECNNRHVAQYTYHNKRIEEGEEYEGNLRGRTVYEVLAKNVDEDHRKEDSSPIIGINQALYEQYGYKIKTNECADNPAKLIVECRYYLI